MPVNRILRGNCYEVMQTLPDGCMDMACTSPPYWGLRDYGIPPVDWPEVTFSPMPGLPPLTIPAESSVRKTCGSSMSIIAISRLNHRSGVPSELK